MNEQVSRRPETKWIHPRFAISSGIERHDRKEHSAVVTMVPTTAVVAALGATAEVEGSEAAAVASGVVVVDAKGICGAIPVAKTIREGGAAGCERGIGRSFHSSRHRATNKSYDGKEAQNR